MAARANLGDATLLVGADADHLVPVRPAQMPQVAVHRSNLQAGRAAARDGIGQVLTLADQRLERLALTAGPIDVHQRDAWLRGKKIGRASWRERWVQYG